MIYQRDSKHAEQYRDLLALMGSLSRLFSTSKVPYLDYRIAERVFCDAFNATDMSRSDISVDAVMGDFGIGLKTFLHNNGKTFQKVAEFNAISAKIATLSPLGKIHYIADARNARIKSTHASLNLDRSIYHLVTRDLGRFLLFEEPMRLIDIASIKLHKRTSSILEFSDSCSYYRFNISKSTLFKQFICDAHHWVDEVSIAIKENPFSLLNKNLKQDRTITVGEDLKSDSARELHGEQKSILLPLYSTKDRNKDVAKKSGLNQWNSSGRARHENEVYIPVPAWIHKKHIGFLPNNTKDTFCLQLPNGERLSAKLCQVGAKGLMSNPNRALGQWILRKVLDVPYGELVTREHLNFVGIDSVRLTKIGSKLYRLDFAPAGSYEKFRAQQIDEGP